MMLYLYVLQNQWIVLALLAGLALLLLFCLTYQAMWRPRRGEEKSGKLTSQPPGGFSAWLKSFLPWVILLLIIACVSFTVATVLAKACRPPNW